MEEVFSEVVGEAGCSGRPPDAVDEGEHLVLTVREAPLARRTVEISKTKRASEGDLLGPVAPAETRAADQLEGGVTAAVGPTDPVWLDSDWKLVQATSVREPCLLAIPPTSERW